MMAELQKGTSVDSIRSGMSSSVEQTATEVERTRQGGQIRTVDFVDKHELHGLRPFLYIQYEYNKREVKNYQFYNPELDAPDFERADKKFAPKNVHFDVVGSKGLIEEQQRQQQTLAWTQFLLSSPLTADLVNITEIAKEGYLDAGHKDPERFLNLTDERDAQQQVLQLSQENQQLQQGVQELQQALQQAESKQQERMADMEMKEQVELAKAQNDELKIQQTAQTDMETAQFKIEKEAELELVKSQNDKELQEIKLTNDKETKMFDLFINNENSDEEDPETKTDEAITKFEDVIESFTKVVAAPKTVERDEQGFITKIKTEA
jgi:hypothetical protein